MKKYFSKVLALVLTFSLVLSAAACGTPNSSTEQPSSPSPSPSGAAPSAMPPSDYEVTEPITIEWWHSQDTESYGDLLKNIVDTFNSSQDKITVEPIYVGNVGAVNEALVAANAANSGLPAISTANTSYVTSYGKSGLCEDMTPYIQATGFDINDFGAGLIEATSCDNKQVTMPYLISTQIMYYNADVAKEKKITIPTKLDEFEAYLKSATQFNADGSTAVYGCVMAGWDYWYFETMYMNNGVEVITADNKSDLNSDAAVAIAAKIKDWVDKGYLYWAVGADAAATLRTMLVDGKAFSVIHTSSTYNTYVKQCKFNVGMAWLPGGQTVNQEIGGVVLMIPAKNDRETKNAAWQFMQYLCGPEVQMQWAYASGYIPTRNSIVNSTEGKAYLEERPSFKDVFANMNYIMPRSSVNGWSEAGKIWIAYMEEMLLKNIDPKTHMNAMVKEIDESLADL